MKLAAEVLYTSWVTVRFFLHHYVHNSITCFDMLYICHCRKSNLVEFQILLVQSPTGVSSGRKSNLGDLGIALESEI